MIRPVLSVLLLKLLSLTLWAYSPQTVFRQLSTEQGLSQNSVFCITQDSTGFIWLGTLNGLNRYDGNQFKVYRPVPGDTTSLADPAVKNLLADHRGYLWVVLNDGLIDRYDYRRDAFDHFRVEPPDSGVEIGYIIAGHTNSSGAGGADGWLIKTDDQGRELWNKTYGGAASDLFFDVQVTNDGGFLLTGRTESFGNGFYDVWVVRTNSSGDTLWTKTFGGPGFDGSSGAVVTSDRGYAIAAQTEYYNSFGSSDGWLIRFSGDPLPTTDFNQTPPAEFRLLNNYPNPFPGKNNPGPALTNIRYQMDQVQYISVTIYNVLGQEVSRLYSGQQTAGIHTLQWSADHLPDGVYFCRLAGEQGSQVRKIVLLH